MTATELKEEIVHFLQTIASERNISLHTLRAYASDLEHFASFWQELISREPIEVTLTMALERYFNMLHHKKISKASIARKMSCFKSFERYINHSKQIELHLEFIRPRINNKLPVILGLDEIFFLLDKVQLTHHDTQFPYRDKAIFEMLYATGICCSELVNIQLKDIDPLKQTINITGKRKKTRLIPFGSACKNKLDLYITHERIKPKSEYEFLFLNYKHEQLTTRSVQRICNLFSSFLDGKKIITPHILRNSYATHLLQQGVDIKQVQELLGHATPASTEKYISLISSDMHTIMKVPRQAHIK